MDKSNGMPTYNSVKQNTYTPITNNVKNDVEFLITNCNGNMDLDSKANINNLDIFFNNVSPCKMPQLIICNDVKNDNQSDDIYKKYMDVITDECGNRFNIHNTRNSGGILQAGYSANIDLDSHLKNINYYNDKCYYDNWKLAPNSKTNDCIGINRNARILTPDYTSVGRNYNDSLCINNTNTNTNTSSSNNSVIWNTPPTDFNCENNIRKRYNFSNNKLQTESCIKPNEWQPFVKATNNVSNTHYQDITTRRKQQLANSITNNTKHDFYKFFDNTQCVIYPNQRLFNNITKRSMLPNQHFQNIDPIHIKT